MKTTVAAPRHLRWLTFLSVLSFLTVFLWATPPSTAAGTDHKVTEGSLTWGVKQSFRSYMVGGIAHGTITASGDAKVDTDHISQYQKATGLVRADGTGVIDYKGTVHYYGHDGELDFTLKDPQLTVEKDGKGHLDMTYQAGKNKPKTLRMADLTGATLKVSGASASFDKAEAKLAKSGMEAFSYRGHAFYEEKTALDPVKTSVTVEDVPSGTVTAPKPKDPVPTKPTPTTPSPSKPTPPATPAPSKPTPAKPKPSGTTSASLTWGVKQSFRSYILGGIANGRIAVSGHATAVSGGYRFAQASTSANPPSANGTTTYSGTVHFTGHGGILDVKFSNPRVQVSGNSGTLIVDYSAPGTGTKAVSIANLNLGQARKSQSGDSVSYQSAPATLTSAGTVVFSYQGHGFYPAGIQLDPVSFTIAKNAHVSGSGSGETAVTGAGATASAPGDASSAASSAATSGIAAAPAGGSSGSSGSLTWGVRSSFRSYILGGIANGSITVGDGASASGSAWTFPQSGAKTADGGAPYRGSVHFMGHGGILNLAFSSPAVHINSSTSATLSVSVNGSRKDMATLDLSRASHSSGGGTDSYSGAPATLTGAGAQVFSYQGHAFYPAGTAMDPVTFTVGSASSATDGSPSSTTSSADAASAGGTSGAAGSSSDKKSGPVNGCPATGTAMSWGFKESFRSYISGSIANGDWKPAGGATYKTPNFVWPQGKGTFDQTHRTGRVTFPGSIHFTGHDGLLDTTINNPSVELSGDKAYLLLDVKSTLMEAAMKGKTEWYENKQARFVELDLSKITVEKKGDKSVITAKNAGTTLTKEGSAAFPNYTAGTAFDPISFTINADAHCVSASGKKPQSAVKDGKASGSDESTLHKALPWLGGGALGALGAGAVGGLARARRNSNTSAGNTDTMIEEDTE